MVNEMTLESARNLDNAQLLWMIKNGLSGAADRIRDACIGVAVARERGISLPTLPSVFDYATQIADGRLSARAAMTLARFPFTVTPIIGMPHDLQDRLADGEKIKIAVKVNGRIQSAERSIWEMSGVQIRAAFDDGKIVPWEKQGEWLHKSGYEEPTAPKSTPPRFDRKSGKIVVGRQRLDIEDFRQAFLEAGFVLRPAYEGRRERKIAK